MLVYLLALIYGGLAYSIRRLTEYRLLKIAYTALFWFFIILAIPLAFAVQHTSIVYAIFGAMLFWWAEKVNDIYTKRIAILFHLLAIATVTYGIVSTFSLTQYLSSYISIAISAFFITYQFIKNKRPLLEKIMLVDGLFFWFLSGLVTISQIENINNFSLTTLFIGITALMIAVIYRLMIKPFGHQVMYRSLSLILLVIASSIYLSSLSENVVISDISAHWDDLSLALWYLFALVFWLVFWVLRQEKTKSLEITQTLFWCFNFIVLLYDFNWLSNFLNYPTSDNQLSLIFITVPLLTAYIIRTFKSTWLIAPLNQNFLISHRNFILALTAIISVVWLLFFSTLGQAFFITWIPILNLYDLGQLLLATCILHCVMKEKLKYSFYMSAVIVFTMITIIITRSIYHWYYPEVNNIAYLLLTHEFFVTEAVMISLISFILVRWINIAPKQSTYLTATIYQCILSLLALPLIYQYSHTTELIIGGVAITLSLLSSSYICYLRNEERFCRIFYAIEILWWLLINVLIIDKFASNNTYYDILLLSLAITGYIASLLYKKAKFFIRELSLTSAVIMSLGIPYFMITSVTQDHLLGGVRSLVWALYIVFSYLALMNLRRQINKETYIAQTFLIIGNIFVFIVEMNYFLQRISTDISVLILSLTLPLLILLALTTYRWKWFIFPYTNNPYIPQKKTHFSFLILAGIIILPTQLLNGVTIGNLWIPILNILELPVYLYIFLVWQSLHKIYDNSSKINLYLLIAICTAISISVIRACYFYFNIPRWSIGIIFNNNVQMALTITWSLLGFIFWIYGSKKHHRLAWNIGATLMGLVLLKLLLIDRSNLGNVAGIISFIGYGLFCLVIGYFAPQPPKKTD